MPALYKIDKSRNLVLTMGFGRVTRKEVLILQDRMSSDPEFNPGFSQVVDFAELTATDIGLTDVQTFAQRDAFSIYARRAIVVKGDLAFGFAKIFELCCQLWGARKIQVFRDLDEAFEWVLCPERTSASPHIEPAPLP